MKGYLALLTVSILCCVWVSCVAPTSSNLWEEAQTIGTDRVFTITIDGKQCRGVLVSATGHPEEVAIRNAHQKAKRFLGNNIREIKRKVVHHDKHNTCVVHILAATH